MWLPGGAAENATRAIKDILQNRGIAPGAKIHCRELFAGSARVKTPFKNLKIQDCHDLLADCVSAMQSHHGRWTGVYVNAEAYPKELRMLEGDTFLVSSKHLAGLVASGACTEMDRLVAANYQLAFDPDRTQIDWGLVRRMQATHFARTDPRAIVLEKPYQCLLDMADFGAYVLCQTILNKYYPTNRKEWQVPFTALWLKMEMATAQFRYQQPKG